MNGTIYANLQLYDPMGQMKIEPGLVYGGQSMFFVLAANDLASGLRKLLDAVAAKGLGLIRLMYAGYTDDFDPDHFPFEVDLPAMVEDALENGEICAVGPYTFPPTAAPETEEVMVACAELFDPQHAVDAPYAGELCLAAVRGNVADGLRAMLDALQERGVQLVMLEDAKDASEHSEIYTFETSLEDLVKQARGVDSPVFSDSMAYERRA